MTKNEINYWIRQKLKTFFFVKKNVSSYRNLKMDIMQSCHVQKKKKRTSSVCK